MQCGRILIIGIANQNFITTCIVEVWFDVILLAIIMLCVWISFSPAPPLTVENIMKEVEGVRNIVELQRWLNGLASFFHPNIKRAVEDFVRGWGHFQTSWRRVMFALDGTGETHLANRIRHYAEPVQGRYML
jgi:hypothetical protein